MFKIQSIRNLFSFYWILILELILLLFGYSIGNYFEVFHITREQAFDLVKETLSNYISLLGIGLAILAILLSVIQLTYKRLSIVKLILENTFFAPLFYFGSINILICAMLFFYGWDSNFISNAFFIRGVVIVNYLFFLLIIFLCFVFFLTFKFVDYSYITNLYLNDLKKLIEKEKHGKTTENFREVLQVKSIELRNEIEANIDENKITVIDKIFDVYSYAFETNPSSIIVQFFRFHIQKWLVETYKKENYIVFHNLLANWRSIYRKGILSKDETRMTPLKLFPSDLYLEGVAKSDSKIKKLVVDYFPIRLKEEARAIIWNYDEKRDNPEQLEKTIQQIAPILFDYNELIHVVALDNNSKLNEVMNEFKMLEEIHDAETDYRNIAFKIKLANIEEKTKDSLSSLELQKYKVYDDFYHDIFAYKFGNLAWLYYECLTKRRKFSDIGFSIACLEKTLEMDGTDFVSRVIRIFFESKYKYNWHDWIWKAEERLTGTTYTLENDESFLAIGFIILSLKRGLNSAHIERLSAETLQESETLIYWVNNTMNFFKPRKDIWMQILGVHDESELEESFGNVSEFINGLSEKKETNYLKALIDEPISPQKVESFRKIIKEQWDESRIVDKVFEFFKAVELNPEQELQFVGHGRINYQKAKFLFVDKFYQNIYGIDWGHEIGRYISDFFIRKISKENSVGKTNAKSLIEVLEESANFEFKNEKLNVVFVPMASWFLIEKELSDSGNYLSSRSSEQKTFPFEYLGIYRNSLIVIPLRAIQKNTAVSLNIPNGASLLRRTNANWIDQKLQLDVIEITRTEAEELLRKQGVSPPFKEELLNEVMAGILIEIGETLDFKVLNPNLIRVFNIP